jgi:hypothetical protein
LIPNSLLMLMITYFAFAGKNKMNIVDLIWTRLCNKIAINLHV